MVKQTLRLLTSRRQMTSSPRQRTSIGTWICAILASLTLILAFLVFLSDRTPTYYSPLEQEEDKPRLPLSPREYGRTNPFAPQKDEYESIEELRGIFNRRIEQIDEKIVELGLHIPIPVDWLRELYNKYVDALRSREFIRAREISPLIYEWFDQYNSALINWSRRSTRTTSGSRATQAQKQEEDKPRPSLSPREYGRTNPFAPINWSRRSTRTTSGSSVTQAQTETTTSKTAQAVNAVNKINKSVAELNKAAEETVVRLTAILGENLAIINESGADRSVSVGDTVGGMKVLEIRKSEDKLILGKGSDELTIGLGTQIKL